MAQVAESLEMIALGLGLGDTELADDVWCYTVINTNSPRQIDVPMAEGLIDFARAGQLSIVTPFCLAGAMAPVTVTGALVLQHAEALGAIALTQLAKPGAPVSYGGFGSNVDMKSGAPAFGTPGTHEDVDRVGPTGTPYRPAVALGSGVRLEHRRHAGGRGKPHVALGRHAGQCDADDPCRGLARGRADVWLREVHQRCRGVADHSPSFPSSPEADEASLGWDALADVEPGGHFFATQHTMDRYATAFYDPLVADLSNFGTWSDSGEQTSTVRATAVWQGLLAAYAPPPGSAERAARLADYVAVGKAKGGVKPSE